MFILMPLRTCETRHSYPPPPVRSKSRTTDRRAAEKKMEKSANLKMESENPEDTEPVSKVLLARVLEDMEFLGLIEFDGGNGPWV
jgi:hypothetical protein